MARNKPLLIPRQRTNRSVPLTPLDSNQADNLFGVVLEMATQQAEMKRKLRAAILQKDTQEVYRLSASLCGLGEDYGTQKGNRTR